MWNLIKSSFFYDYLLFLKSLQPIGRRRDTPAARLGAGLSPAPPQFFQALAEAGGRTSGFISTNRIYK